MIKIKVSINKDDAYGINFDWEMHEGADDCTVERDELDEILLALCNHLGITGCSLNSQIRTKD